MDLPHALDGLLLCGGLFIRIGQDQRQPFFSRGLLDTLDHLGVEQVGDVREDQADRVGPPFL